MKAFLLGDAFLRRFISEAILFDELPPADRGAKEAYLDTVEQCEIYLAIFSCQYGYEDENGISPTENKYNHATKHQKFRFVYVWGRDDSPPF